MNHWQAQPINLKPGYAACRIKRKKSNRRQSEGWLLINAGRVLSFVS